MANRKAPKKPVKKKKIVEQKFADLGDTSGMWTPLNSRGYGYNFGSGNGNQPSPIDLLGAFIDVSYSAIHLVAPNVSKEANRYKLVVSTGRNDSTPRSSRKSFDYHTKQRIEKAYPEYARRAVELEEIVEHPILDLLDKPNEMQSFRKLVELIDVYLEIVGSSFVLIKKLDLGTTSIPTALWVLPSQFIQIEIDEATGDLKGYKYKHGEVEIFYKPDEIIHFKNVNPMNPYTGMGVSPVRAVWERIQLLEYEQASWQSVLQNMTFPTVLINPPDGEQYTPNQAQRIEKQLSEKGRLGGGQGGIWVVTENMKINPFITPPKDLSALQLYQAIRSSIATAFNIPLAMLDLNTEGSEASDTVRRNFQQYCLSPRIDNILETFSHHLLPSRMWLVADSIVSPDKVFELQKATAGFSGGGLTLNEFRHALGEPPDSRIGNKYQFELQPGLGTASAQTFQTSAPSGRTKSVRRTYQSVHPDPTPLADALRAVFTKLSDSIVGKIKAVPAPRTKAAFFPLETWTDELKRTLTPIMRAYGDEGLDAIFAAIGGSADMMRHAVLNLDEAVNRAVLALSKSTLDTTEKGVEDAVSATREAIRDGLNHGEAHDQLATRIKDVFEDLTTRRCVLIAETEASRAKHFGELIAIKESGIDAKKIWLADSQCCNLCRSLQAKGAIPLNEPFYVDAKGGPYATVQHAPAHPACRCSLSYSFGD